LKICHLRY